MMASSTQARAFCYEQNKKPAPDKKRAGPVMKRCLGHACNHKLFKCEDPKLFHLCPDCRRRSDWGISQGVIAPTGFRKRAT